jgi:hypothetical protein
MNLPIIYSTDLVDDLAIHLNGQLLKPQDSCYLAEDSCYLAEDSCYVDDDFRLLMNVATQVLFL